MQCLCGVALKQADAPTDSLVAGCSGRGVHTASLAGSSSGRSLALPFASLSQATLAKPKAPDASVGSVGSAAGGSGPADKPAHDVVAGAMARAASQSTIHPLDTMKVRMQAGVKPSSVASSSGSVAAGARGLAAGVSGQMQGRGLVRGLTEVASLYKGVVSAATGAGIIIGAYFAFYSTSKRFLKQRTNLADGQVAFVSGAAAAVGSSVVKVPIAVCIRSVQAGVYPNVGHAARSIVGATGVQGLFTGFLPTLLEDIPDMAVKFAVYETLRNILTKFNGRQPSTVEDLLMGGSAGAAAAAATTPLDVVKTRMMCVAASRPTFLGAAREVMQQGGPKAFFRGVGPRALSNGLNSAVFFCFFEAIRRGLVTRLQEQQQQQQQRSASAAQPQAAASAHEQQRAEQAHVQQQRHAEAPQLLAMAAASSQQGKGRVRGSGSGGRMACLSLAVPLHLAVPGWKVQQRM